LLFIDIVSLEAGAAIAAATMTERETKIEESCMTK
jgi:hypothetical protein